MDWCTRHKIIPPHLKYATTVCFSWFHGPLLSFSLWYMHALLFFRPPVQHGDDATCFFSFHQKPKPYMRTKRPSLPFCQRINSEPRLVTPISPGFSRFGRRYDVFITGIQRNSYPKDIHRIFSSIVPTHVSIIIKSPQTNCIERKSVLHSPP